jgi:hypothetical protein
VVTGDSGRPIKRARVLASAAELAGGRGTLTDDNGAFELADLPAGRYTVVASKTGFITLSYGQRRPMQGGTPLQLADGQELKGVDFSLPRGGAIAGRILDEDGEPMPGANVRVMRYQYQQGDRRLVQAGNGQTDDKGQYRVWGLMPGDYYVTATARSLGPIFGPGGRGLGGPAGRGGPGLFGGRGGFFGSDDQESTTYAPTYFPGVQTVADATAITLGVSQEAQDINFALQLVRTARVSGRVTSSDGTPATNGTITISPEGSGAGAGRGGIGLTYGGRIQADGSFSVANVPPGRYTVRARGGGDERAMYAQQGLTVAGDDVSGVAIVLSSGGTITGSVTFQATQLQLPSDVTSIRISAPPADAGQYAATVARVDKDGRFVFDGVPAGPRFIRATGAPRGWSLASVLVSGREMIDTPVDVRSGQTIANVSLVFTDRQTQISGTVTTAQGTPVSDFTILAFPIDQSLWRPQSRQIMTTRPDQNGKYQLRGLPPGQYYLALVDPVENGEWFEATFLDQQRGNAVRLTLSDGEVKTQDFRIK